MQTTKLESFKTTTSNLIHLIRYLLITLVLIVGCNKDQPDFRQPYTGTFEFTRMRNVIEMCYEPSKSCIDGWTIFRSDTTNFTSQVQLYKGDRLSIQFSEGKLGIFNDSIIQETIYPIVSEDGILAYPELMNSCGRTFTGKYVGYDEITVNFQYGCGVGIYFEYFVRGVRKK